MCVLIFIILHHDTLDFCFVCFVIGFCLFILSSFCPHRHLHLFSVCCHSFCFYFFIYVFTFPSWACMFFAIHLSLSLFPSLFFPLSRSLSFSCSISIWFTLFFFFSRSLALSLSPFLFPCYPFSLSPLSFSPFLFSFYPFIPLIVLRYSLLCS